MTQPSPSPDAAVVSRRDFLRTAAVAGAAPLAAGATLPTLAAGSGLAAPLAGAQGAPTPVTGSDVGTLFPFIRSQVADGPAPRSFLAPGAGTLAAWTPTARATVFDLLHYAPPPCDPAAEITARVDCGDYIREHVTFNTTPDVRVPAFVLVPKGLTAPAPAIVALHDHGGFYLWGKEKLVAIDGEHPVFTDFRARYYGGRAIAIDLVRQGYVVVVIDMFYWGDRRMLLDADPADWRTRPASLPGARIDAFNARASQSEQLVGRSIFAAGFTWAGVMFWDDIRTVDYLLTRDDVDPQRIGCVGLSVGAVRSAHLAALDPRIRAGVVVCWMTSFRAQLQHHVRNTIGHTKLVPGLYQQLDYPDVASLAMPRPLLVMSGSKDGLFPVEGISAAFETLRACYAKAGVPDHCRTLLYDSPHQFNAEMQTEAWAWLRRFV